MKKYYTFIMIIIATLLFAAPIVSSARKVQLPILSQYGNQVQPEQKPITVCIKLAKTIGIGNLTYKFRYDNNDIGKAKIMRETDLDRTDQVSVNPKLNAQNKITVEISAAGKKYTYDLTDGQTLDWLAKWKRHFFRRQITVTQKKSSTKYKCPFQEVKVLN